MARRPMRFGKNKDGGPTVLVRLVLVLCVVSSMALVLQLNLATQQEYMLRNVKGFDEGRVWRAQSSPATCRPVRHVVFLKTHKCGSSTLQNVLFRVAQSWNLSVALPQTGVYLDNPSEGTLKPRDLKDGPFAPPTKTFHLLMHHTRLNVKAIQQLTFPDAMWITIVREPAAVFESLFHFYHLQRFYGGTFEELLWKLDGTHGSKYKLKNNNNRYLGRLGRSQMTWDLGLDDQDMRQEGVVKGALKYLDSTFHLVMVAEYMDESLVLLKHLMCWRDRDVLVMSRNVRKDRYRSYLGEAAVNTLEKFNAADVKIYAFFKERFERQIEEFGRGRMEEEVAKLREYREKVWRECGLKEATGPKAMEKEQQYVIQYSVNTNNTRQRMFCKDLVRTGVEFTQIQRWRQYSRYHANQRAFRHPFNASWGARRMRRRGGAGRRVKEARKGKAVKQNKPQKPTTTTEPV